jgi:YD repeat-containing protein
VGKPQGQSRIFSFADGASKSATVNAAGWITALTDENGFITDYACDEMGRLSRITDPVGTWATVMR